MAEEIQEAVQIIRVAYDGIEIAMKIGSGGLEAVQKAIEFLRGILDYEKSIGKTSMRKLLMKGGDLQIFRFKTSETKKVEKMAKKYGITYSILPDINKKDGMSEIIFHSEATPRVNMMNQKLGFGKVESVDAYLNGKNKEQLSELMEFLNGQKMGNDKIHTEGSAIADQAMDSLIEKVGMFAMEKENISVDSVEKKFSLVKEQAEEILKQLESMGILAQRDDSGNHKVIVDQEAFKKRIKGYRELTERMRAVARAKDPNLVDVTISKLLIEKESETAVKTRVPGTWGENVRFIWVNKENIMDIHDGKTILTFLDKNKDYKLYDRENRVVATQKGKELYDHHYDRVEAAVREKFEKIQNSSTKRTKTTARKGKKR